MPELPEVEASRRRLQRWLRGRRLAQVTVVEDTVVFGSIRPRDIVAALRGRRVRAVRRRGKHLWLELDRRPWLTLHFGMTAGREEAETGRASRSPAPVHRHRLAAIPP